MGEHSVGHLIIDSCLKFCATAAVHTAFITDCSIDIRECETEF